MTLNETGIIMDILTTAYPRFYAGPDAPDMEKTLSLWAEMFQNDDVALVAAAVKAVIESDEKGFPPHIGAVKAKIRLLTHSDEMTEAEAWGLVVDALKNSTYSSSEEFKKLPPVIQRIVGRPSQLREWARMDADTVHSVVASNFQRSYRVISQREREISKLPLDVKAIVVQLANRQKMEALPEPEEEIPSQEEPEEPPAPAPKEKLVVAMGYGTGRSREEVLAWLKKVDP